MTTYVLREPGGASEAKQDAILTELANTLAELQQKLEQGQQVALDPATLNALENVNAVVSGTVTVADAATEAKQDLILVALGSLLTELGQKLEQGQPVALDTATLNALENLTVSGPLTDVELRASDVNTADSGEREYLHITDEVTDAGDTVIYTPAPGKAIRLRWVFVTQALESDPFAKVTVKLGADEVYKFYGPMAKRQKKTGAVNAALVINLSGSGNVAVTAILEEV